jgi:hemerythrin-like domain-containing protein
MLELIRTAAVKLAAGEEVNPNVFAKGLDFFRNFADRCHHGKEERHLFAKLVEKGVPQQGGPVGVMLAEHEEGRSHIRGMAEALTRLQAGESGAARDLAAHAQAYVDLLSAHIRKEDTVLFPLADRLLTPEEQAELEEIFARVETEEMGEGVHERYHRLIHEVEGELMAHRA